MDDQVPQWKEEGLLGFPLDAPVDEVISHLSLSSTIPGLAPSDWGQGKLRELLENPGDGELLYPLLILLNGCMQSSQGDRVLLTNLKGQTTAGMALLLIDPRGIENLGVKVIRDQNKCMEMGGLIVSPGNPLEGADVDLLIWGPQGRHRIDDLQKSLSRGEFDHGEGLQDFIAEKELYRQQGTPWAVMNFKAGLMGASLFHDLLKRVTS